MYHIVNVHDHADGIEKCIEYFHAKWGSQDNFLYFADAIRHSSSQGAIPQFYVLVHEHDKERIVGCYGLIINDFISRHDLYPWFSSLFIEPEHRGKRLSERLLAHAAQQAANMGYKQLYLTTDLDGFYEKSGWQRMADGISVTGAPTRIYCKGLG